jgi:hypothetical protein
MDRSIKESTIINRQQFDTEISVEDSSQQRNPTVTSFETPYSYKDNNKLRKIKSLNFKINERIREEKEDIIDSDYENEMKDKLEINIIPITDHHNELEISISTDKEKVVMVDNSLEISKDESLKREKIPIRDQTIQNNIYSPEIYSISPVASKHAKPTGLRLEAELIHMSDIMEGKDDDLDIESINSAEILGGHIKPSIRPLAIVQSPAEVIKEETKMQYDSKSEIEISNNLVSDIDPATVRYVSNISELDMAQYDKNDPNDKVQIKDTNIIQKTFGTQLSAKEKMEKLSQIQPELNKSLSNFNVSAVSDRKSEPSQSLEISNSVDLSSDL